MATAWPPNTSRNFAALRHAIGDLNVVAVFVLGPVLAVFFGHVRVISRSDALASGLNPFGDITPPVLLVAIAVDSRASKTANPKQIGLPCASTAFKLSRFLLSCTRIRT